MPALEKKVTITNRRGLHARAAAKFVRYVENQKADVRVLKDGMDVCGASIMGLLMLSASINTEITIRVEGDGGDVTLNDLVTLVEGRFGEEE